MMKSMTGFGCAEGSLPGGLHVRIELSGVNRKQLDIRAGVPRELQFFELRMRELIAAKISRGIVFVRFLLRNEGSGASNIRIDTAAAELICKSARTLRETLGLSGELTLPQLLKIPGVVVQVEPDFESDASAGALETIFNEALAGFDAMRLREGEALRRDFEGRLSFLSASVDELERLTDSLTDIFRERILSKIAELSLNFMSDEERLMKEVFFYCQKADVAEELTRLRSHVEQMRETLSLEGGGRKLEFIVQEMQREITTLGNKAPGVEVTPIVVNVKTEIDRMKEQVQNVE